MLINLINLAFLLFCLWWKHVVFSPTNWKICCLSPPNCMICYFFSSNAQIGIYVSTCLMCLGRMLFLLAYLLLSASCGSVPGRLIVMVLGELTSYFLWGFLQIRILTIPMKIEFEIMAITGCNWLGKKLEKNNRGAVWCQSINVHSHTG